ncbi:DNA-3-methyladenine glycosylase family protein [Paramicrobacterium fandaimingii]|uniref:DNA-3-methyladenine glycosylase family protein n=1 Tax=Paramicrobacterium fandaimingii TaxID=2708079 RepID=UPI0014234274|nr:DNA-3-methyladenine glycosylase 2 family protein [Microbacterium fandaimingii]
MTEPPPAPEPPRAASLPHRRDIPFIPPYDVEALCAAQRTHAVAGIDAPELSERRLAAPTDQSHQDADISRGIRHNGINGTLSVRFADDSVELRSSQPIDAALEHRVRRWLDLDADPAETAARLGGDPVMAPLVGKRPGLRILGHIDDIEAASFAVLGQQVSLASARTFQRRFVAAFAPQDETTGYRHFPDAAELAALETAEIRDAVGLTRARAATLHAVIAELASGLTLTGDTAEIRERLLRLRGIGPWTADYLAVRAVGDRDAFPSGDLVLRRAMGAADARAAIARGEAWRPLRAYATFHLWTEFAYCAQTAQP